LADPPFEPDAPLEAKRPIGYPLVVAASRLAFGGIHRIKPTLRRRLSIATIPVRIGQVVVEVIAIHAIRHAQLLEIVDAPYVGGPGLGLGQRWQQHGRQNGNDGDDDEQLDQGET